MYICKKKDACFTEKNLNMAAFIISLIVELPLFAGMLYFMYRYHLGKQNLEKNSAYDFLGMLFLVFVNVGGMTGMFGNALKSAIPSDNARMLVSLAITLLLVAVADIVARVMVRRKMSDSESE